MVVSTGETVVVIERRNAHAHPICARLVDGFHRESEVFLGLNEIAPVEQSWDFRREQERALEWWSIGQTIVHGIGAGGEAYLQTLRAIKTAIRLMVQRRLDA